MSVTGAALAGINAAIRQIDQAADNLSRLADPSSAAQIDVSTEAVRLLSARSAFLANVKLARAANELDKKLVDLMA
jgi:hypothetical protein